MIKAELKRYIIIGVSVYLFELLIIFTAINLGSSSVFAVGLSFWLGLIVSFLLQKIVTFRDKRVHHKILLPQIIAYSLLVLFNFAFTVGFTALLDDNWPPAVLRTIALGITTIWNFYLYKTRIFKMESPLID